MAGVVALGFAYIFSQFYRSFLAILVPNLKADLGVTADTLSQASGAFFLAFAIMQFVVGASLDQYGPKRTVSVLLGVFATAGAALFATAQSGSVIIISMILLGMGCSGVLISSMYIYIRRFSAARFALYCSILVGIGTSGNIVGATPLAIAIETFGWRETLSGLAVATAVIALILYILVEDPAPDTSDPNDVLDNNMKGFRGTLHILKMPVLWVIFPVLFVHYGVAAGVRGLWISPYFEDLFSLSVREIGTVTFYMSVAMVIGTWMYGPLDKWLNTRKWIVWGGTLIMMICCGVLAIDSSPTFTVAVIAFIGIGFMGMGFPVIVAHGKSFIRPSMIGRGVSTLNFFSMGGAATMQFVTGRLYDSAPTSVDGYQHVMIFYTIVLSLAIVIYLFSRDVKPQSI